MLIFVCHSKTTVMKRAFYLFTVLCLAFVSCGGADDTIILTDIKIDKISRELKIGDTYQMSITTTPRTDKVKTKWSSSNQEVATISGSGLLTALAEGFTRITATVGTLSHSVAVIVNSGETQDYTSFVVVIESTNDFRDCVAGYFAEDGLCHKIGDLGNLGGGKVSPEIILKDESISEYDIYIFYDLYDDLGIYDLTGRAGAFKLESMKKNYLLLDGHFNGISVSKNNPSKYPH